MANPTAGQVAAELRRVADALDRHPEVEVSTAFLTFHGNDYFSTDNGREKFLNTVKVLPRPLKKTFGVGIIEVENLTSALRTRAYIDRSAVCEIVEPAKPAVYHCPSLLSDEEMDEAIKEF
jgi:hypothetical protein